MTALPDEEPSKNDFFESAKFWFVVLLFFFSGASSLIYQVIWTRQMVFIFGSSTFASATVLSAFMGGLALGSYLAAKFADRIKNPFLAYGILEAATGVWALLTPTMFDLAQPLCRLAFQQLHLSVLPFSLLRFFTVAAILLVPTACMGATLPLLSRYVTASLSVVGRHVGTLYAVNTLGAVAGVLAGGFYLIPSFGLYASTITASAVNLLLAGAVVIYTRYHVQDSTSAGCSPEDAKQEQPGQSFQASVVFGAFAASGAIAMLYEVAWTRALSLVIGSTTYAFSIMLATFLLGIASGSFQSARLADRLKEPGLGFGFIQILLGLAGLLSVALFNYIPYWNIVANLSILNNADLGMAVRFMLAGAVLLPFTFLLGAIFPLAVKACTLEFSKVGRSVGELYSVNTCGAIIGAFAAGFFIIPFLGGQQSLICGAAANIVLGTVLILSLAPGRFPVKLSSIILALGVVIWASQSPSLWDMQLLTVDQKLRRGLNYQQNQIPPFAEYRAQVSQAIEVLHWQDGPCANVAVGRFKETNERVLFTNGHIDASDGPNDMPTQVLLSSLPLLLKPHSVALANIGWGSGCTPGYALLFPISKIVCAEIEPLVLQASSFFHHVNLVPEKDSRLRFQINDGRNFLLGTPESFDIICSEPSNPWQAGVCNLYTMEYFRICHDRLKQAGIFAMWWQYNEVSSNDLSRVFAALKKVFKHVVVFQSCPGDILILSSDQPLKANLSAISAALSDGKLQKLLSTIAGINSAEDLLLLARMADDGVELATAGIPPNTDDRNFIEFDLARNYEQRNLALENHLWMREHCGTLADLIDWSDRSPQQKALVLADIAERAMLGKNDTADLWADQSYRAFANASALGVKALYYVQQKGDFDSGLVEAEKAVRQFPNEFTPYMVRGLVELRGGAPLRARADFAAALKLQPNNSTVKFRLAQTYLPDHTEWYQTANLPMSDTGKAASDPGKVIELIGFYLKDDKQVADEPLLLAAAGAAYLQLGQTDDSINALEKYRIARPDDICALQLLSSAYSARGKKKEAVSCLQRATELSRAMSIKLSQGAQVLLSHHKLRLALSLLKRAIKFNPDSHEARSVLHELAPASLEAQSYMKELAATSAADLEAYKELEERFERAGRRN